MRTRRLQAPPVPKEHPHNVQFGSHTADPSTSNLIHPPISRPDPLFWLRDDQRKDPNVLSHLRAENSHTRFITRHHARLRARLYNEILHYSIISDCSVPVRRGPWQYYRRVLSGKPYKLYCRRACGHDSEQHQEVILLDVNQLSRRFKFCHVASVQISPDHSYMAYTIDTSGYETYQIRIVDLSCNKQVDVIHNTSSSFEWGQLSNTIYYTTFDSTHRPFKFWLHHLRHAPDSASHNTLSDDVCLYTETDSQFSLAMSKSLSSRFIFLCSEASTLTEVRFIDLNNVEAGLCMFRPRQTGIIYYVTHARHDSFYVISNENGATNMNLFRVDLKHLCTWLPLLPYDEGRTIDEVLSFQHFAVLVGRQHGYKQIWFVPDHQPDDMFIIPTNEVAHSVSLSDNIEYCASSFRYQYSSLTTPEQIWEFRAADRKQVLLKERVVADYNRHIYKTERVEAISNDGTAIPISLVYNSQAVSRDGANKLVLYGYGSYEISMDPSFSEARLPLLNRGVIYAIAHVRGGGEYGRQWYEAAKFESKIKTFEDFIACGKFLVKSGRTTSDMMCMEGHSAGGLLVGAVMNMQPDLFCAAIAGVPFVDVLNSMSDASIPLTTGEWQEWGNPHEVKYYKAMSEYCPYSNVAAKNYPATLILAGLNDSRVMYSEPTKWAAKLRKFNTSKNEILLKVDMSSGHFSSSDRYSYMKERSFVLAWLLRQLNAPDRPVAV